MAEKVKKEKAPAKPRTPKTSGKMTVATKVADASPLVAKTPTQGTRTPPHDDIARLAYRFWNERGRQIGRHEQDWLRAERELKKA